MRVDLPALGEIQRLLAVEATPCVSIYLPTNPEARDVEAERIGWKNVTSTALAQLVDLGVDKRGVVAFADSLGDIDDDETSWYHQANTLAVFTDGERLRSYHLPSRLEPSVTVSDRYFVKPLLRAVTFPQACFVLALAQGSVRVLEVGADYGPYEVAVPGLPGDADAFVNKATRKAQAPRGRLQGDEGRKVRARQFARAVERAVREALRGHDLPLILAATEPIESMYRNLSTSPHLVAESIALSPEKVPDLELATAARAVLTRVYADQLADLRTLFEERTGQGRVVTDLSDLALAATRGMVDTLVVDIDVVVHGTIDHTGRLEYSDDRGAYGVVDEIARRVLQARGTVVAVRAHEVPGGGSAAAILRYS